MAKAAEVAIELRKLADALDREPEAEVRHPWVTFYCQRAEEKTAFLNTARLLPHPLKKEYESTGKSWDRLRLTYGEITTGPIHVVACIPRSFVCRIVQPAQEAIYECEPLLSPEEESLIGEKQEVA